MPRKINSKVEDQYLMNWLKTKREAAHLSQSDVSDKLGYATPQFISNWERGVSVPPRAALPKIAKLYRVDLEVLEEAVYQASLLMFKAKWNRA